MPDGEMKSSELLSPGGQPALGATHAENMGLPYLGSGSAAGTEALERLRQAGMVDESNPAERGGGGDMIDNWVAKNGGYDKLIQQIQQNGWGDNLVWKLTDGTQISVAEVKRRVAAAVSPPPPEPQPAPQPADWRADLSPDQQQWLVDLQRNFGVDKDEVLLALQNMIKEIDSNPRQLSRDLLSWSGSRNELRVILLRLGGEVQHQVAMENVLKLSPDRQQNTGEQIAAQFLVELRQVLAKQFPNDLEKQNELVINLYERLRRDDALGFSPNIGLIPRGADIGILMRILKSTLGRNGG